MAFLAFEGLDGSGKSTLIRGLTQALENRGISYVVTREPGGTELGDEIRQLLLKTEGEAPVSRCELLLYGAGRAQHVDKLIRPSLAEGKWVLCDRFSASSVAFQEGGRGLDLNAVSWLNDFATDKTYPDLWVLLDFSAEDSAKRTAKREQEDGQNLDRFEKEARDFHERVRQSYLRQAKEGKDNWLVIDANLSPEEILKEVLQALEARGFL